MDLDHASVATALNDVAFCMHSLGRAGQALPWFEQALTMRQRLFGDGDHPNIAASLNNVATCLQALGRADEALPRFEQALAMRRALIGDRDHSDIAVSLNNMAACLESLGRANAALPQYEQALAMNRRLFGDGDHLDVARSMNNVAHCLHSLGRAGEALPVHEQTLAMRKRLFGDRDHLDVATSLNNVAAGLQSLGRADESLTRFEQALAMQRRLIGDRDHPALATGLNNVAGCLQPLGRADEALPVYEQALAMNKRLFGDRDHPALATGLNNVAGCMESLGRAHEALPIHEQSLAMRKRLFGDRDHPAIATGLNGVANCLGALGRRDEALLRYEQFLAMNKRLFGDRDHPHVATGLSNLAQCLQSLGRAHEALPMHEQSLAMRKRLFGDQNHIVVATSLNNVAYCLQALGRSGEALPHYEQALVMYRHLFGDRDHADVAANLNNVGLNLQALGRADEALPRHQQALAMRMRLFGGRDHSHVAAGLNNVANCLQMLGRADEALPHYEQALAMYRHLSSDRDHPDVASGLNGVATCLQSLDRDGEALPRHEQALAMQKRLFGERDHPDVATGLNNVAANLASLGRAGEALPLYEQALAMRKRLFGERDHPHVAASLNNEASCLQSLGHPDRALPRAEAAVTMIERMRDALRLSPELRQSLFEDMKRDGTFERFQHLATEVGRPVDALHAAERCRGRGLLDQLEQFGDLEVEAQRRARLRGDEVTNARLGAVRRDLEATRTASDRLLHELTRLAEATDASDRDARRKALLAESNAAATQLRQLLDERARLLGDMLPVGRVRTPGEIQSALQPGELLLEFTVTSDVALLYVLAHEGTAEVLGLPNAFTTMERGLSALMERSSRTQQRGRDPEAIAAARPDTPSTELFMSLMPAPLWERVRKCSRVFVAAHRRLHHLPFELLVTAAKDGKPTYWLDDGPPISYVPSGTLLHWLRQRPGATSDDGTSLDLLAVGDPGKLDAAPEVPLEGVFVAKVNDNGEGARLGLQPGDVLISYDGQPLTDDKSLRDVRMSTEKAIEDGRRGKTPIPIGVWRRGSTVKVEANPGALGIEVGKGKARAAFEASLGSDAWLERIKRAGDLERIRHLSPLRGARAETEAIEKMFADKKAKTRRLLGAEATETAVFDLASEAKYLHFACHGLAEEYAGQSLSMLVLSLPQHVLPGDDGLLKLSDLWNNWRGRLSSTHLVVLSACRTNVGPTGRDEAPQALPIGFFFAGVPSVISSLWAVDDQSTRELMTDFYGRLLAGETDKLAAFTAAKKALRAKYPDPFHWAPFLFLGAPE
ncbi:MAG: tetratricopeptide repeat protein [Planctomycetota bacterium]